MTFPSPIRLTCLSLLTLVALSGAPHAQTPAPTAQAPACSLTWLGKEDAIEEYLRTATIVKMEIVPIGVTKPERAVFEPGGLVARAAWKPIAPSYRSGFHESYKSELAAYALDRLLDLHRVPPVVERRIGRGDGALVYWIENIHGWDIKKPPVGPDPRWGHEVSRMRMFDQLIANIDRNAGNLLYDDDWHLFLIDHSRAFIERKDLSGTTPPSRIDREFWTKIEALDLPTLQGALGKWLTPKELNALLARRDRMREAIKKMVAERGEANVFI